MGTITFPLVVAVIIALSAIYIFMKNGKRFIQANKILIATQNKSILNSDAVISFVVIAFMSIILGTLIYALTGIISLLWSEDRFGPYSMRDMICLVISINLWCYAFGLLLFYDEENGVRGNSIQLKRILCSTDAFQPYLSAITDEDMYYQIPFDSVECEEVIEINKKYEQWRKVENQLSLLEENDINTDLSKSAKEKNAGIKKEIAEQILSLISKLKETAYNPKLDTKSKTISEANSTLEEFMNEKSEAPSPKFLQEPAEVLELRTIIAHNEIPKDIREHGARLLKAIQEKNKDNAKDMKKEELILNAKLAISATEELHGFATNQVRNTTLS